MICISSSCVKSKNIKESITFLYENGFENIEISGGTDYYEYLEKDLFYLKEKYNLNFIFHNYFPPPKEHFVLNLASLDKNIFEKSLEHYKKAIELSQKLGINRFGLHAGSFIDISLKNIGKTISFTEVYNKNKATERFCEGYNILKKYSGYLKLYIENNVLSFSNYQTYKTNPFMLTNLKEYKELKEKLNFPLLLDIAHLKVSCNTLGLNFETELEHLLPLSDYIHISDNDGKHDTNNAMNQDSKLYNILKKYNFNNKILTLEIYESIDKIKHTYEILEKI